MFGSMELRASPEAALGVLVNAMAMLGAATANSPQLALQLVDLGKHPLATCNDGTPGS